MRRQKIEVDPITLFIWICLLIGGVLVVYTMAALPTMIDESVAVSQKNRLQKVIRDAYNSTAKY